MNRSGIAYVVRRNDAGAVVAGIEPLAIGDLPPGDLRIEVDWSSLNYKDALAARGHPGVARCLPHVPGIDAAGMVVESGDPRYQPGDQVLVTGYELGAGQWGGWATWIRVPADWAIPLPSGLTLRESMIYGTAGFTAALGLLALTRHEVTPDRGEVLVTGATGGVGSLAVQLLARQGYRVVAATGKPQQATTLRAWGAARVISRDELAADDGKPLLAARWAGAIDTVGGETLARLVRSTQIGGCVAACGLVGGHALSLTIYPFLLRGVALDGIDSAWCPRPQRLQIWQRLAADWKLENLAALARETDLQGISADVDRILAGQVVGRTLVRPHLHDT